MRRVQKEFEDFMMTRTQGKLVEQLVVSNRWNNGAVPYGGGCR